MRVVSGAQMREADRRTIEEVGVPSAVLMEHAGQAVLRAMDETFGPLETTDVSVLCGRGHNGGDGLVVARLLAERGDVPLVCLLGRVDQLRGDPLEKARQVQATGTDILEIADDAAWQACRERVLGASIVVDALFGTGLSRPLDGLAAAVVEHVNEAGRPVVAVDLPSGLDADRAAPIGPTIAASLTVTMAAPKLPLVMSPGDRLAGRLVVADIGIPSSVVETVPGPRVDWLTRADVAPLVPARSPESNKGDYGRVLIVAGSTGHTGAAALAALAALRSGAGLVTVATPASCLPVIAALGAEYMTLPLAEASDGGLDQAAVDGLLSFKADVIALGPGLGRARSTEAFVRRLVAGTRLPLVVDADGLNAFEGAPEGLRRGEGLTTIVTPHPGEMARLAGGAVADVQARRIEVARDFAAAGRLTVVLKGHRTIVATPDGSVAINSTGNPGMATAGTGDVLTGMTAAWLAQTRDPAVAARLAVFLHGLAGDLARRDEGEVALIARDLLQRLGAAEIDLAASKTAGRGPA
ncbi:MAG: NAD(P)H-hydrate dehydratase [Vicinamibacterales bacterium]